MNVNNFRTWKIATILMCFLLSAAACQLRPDIQTTDTEQSPGIIRPTETLRVWATIASDNVATPSPTPALQPISFQLQGRIAFQSDRDGSLEIYVMNADGSTVSRLTNNPSVDVHPSWSQDGSQIAFTSNRDGYPDIFSIDPDGTNLHKVTKSTSTDMFPSWSPDGSQIVFVSNRDGNDEIYSILVDGGSAVRLTDDPGEDYFPDWSPDGGWIAFTTTRDVNPEIYKMRADGTELTRLTDNPADDSNPAWSPDGTSIAFTSRRNGFSDLYLMDTDGSNIIQLTSFMSVVDEPTWSPDGRVIAFASDMVGSEEIYAINVNGAEMTRLTEFPQEDFYPSWSPAISYLETPLAVPTVGPEGVCINSDELDYGFSPENPIRIGYDPRSGHEGEHAHEIESECLPWLLGPQGQTVKTKLLEEVRVSDTLLCKVSVSYDGQETEDTMYFDVFNYEQPKAPLGYTCGSPVEYLKAVTAAKY